jgi:hypothetical protein
VIIPGSYHITPSIQGHIFILTSLWLRAICLRHIFQLTETTMTKPTAAANPTGLPAACTLSWRGLRLPEFQPGDRAADAAALYDALTTLHRVSLAMTCQPRFQRGEWFSPAGECLDALQEAISMSCSQIADSLGLAATREDNDDRAEVLIVERLRCGDVWRVPALSARLLADDLGLS